MLCINLSGEVSATYQAAVAAAEAVTDRSRSAPRLRSLTMGLGLMVIDAADLAADGATLDELAARVEALIRRTEVFGVVDTLEHLEKGGRIGGARALLGSLLSIKPVVTAGRRTWSRRVEATDPWPVAALPGRQGRQPGPRSAGWPCATARPPTSTTSSPCSKDVKSEFPLVVVDLGPVVGTHTGPGTDRDCHRPVD